MKLILPSQMKSVSDEHCVASENGPRRSKTTLNKISDKSGALIIYDSIFNSVRSDCRSTVQQPGLRGCARLCAPVLCSWALRFIWFSVVSARAERHRASTYNVMKP